MALKELYLLRHGELPEQVKGLFVGQNITPLSKLGKASCDALAPLLKKLAPVLLFSSPLLRAEDSAKRMFPDRTPVLDARLSEMDFGKCDMHDFQWIEENFPDFAKDWMMYASRPEMRFPGGESVAEIAERVHSFMEMLMQSPEESAAIVTHGGVIVHILAELLSIEKGHEWEFLPARGSLTIVKFREGSNKGILKLFNYRPRELAV